MKVLPSVCNICFKRLNIVQSRQKKSVGVLYGQRASLDLTHDFVVVAVSWVEGD